MGEGSKRARITFMDLLSKLGNLQNSHDPISYGSGSAETIVSEIRQPMLTVLPITFTLFAEACNLVAFPM